MPIEKDAQFSGSVPAAYERHLAPVIFEPFAVDLASRLDPAREHQVLEVACGTGVLTRHLRERLGPDDRLVASDLNEGMFDVAKERIGPITGSSGAWPTAPRCRSPKPSSTPCSASSASCSSPSKARRACARPHRCAAPGRPAAVQVRDRAAADRFGSSRIDVIGDGWFRPTALKFYETPLASIRPQRAASGGRGRGLRGGAHGDAAQIRRERVGGPLRDLLCAWQPGGGRDPGAPHRVDREGGAGGTTPWRANWVPRRAAHRCRPW